MHYIISMWKCTFLMAYYFRCGFLPHLQFWDSLSFTVHPVTYSFFNVVVMFILLLCKSMSGYIRFS